MSSLAPHPLLVRSPVVPAPALLCSQPTLSPMCPMSRCASSVLDSSTRSNQENQRPSSTWSDEARDAAACLCDIHLCSRAPRSTRLRKHQLLCHRILSRLLAAVVIAVPEARGEKEPRAAGAESVLVSLLRLSDLLSR